jgi:hypothetical protein
MPGTEMWSFGVALGGQLRRRGVGGRADRTKAGRPGVPAVHPTSAVVLVSARHTQGAIR